MGTMTTKEEALARRRAQNREAQRRFRSKQSQQTGQAAVVEQDYEQQHTGTDIEPGSSLFVPHSPAPSTDALPASLALPTPEAEDPSSGCFITSGLRLFGNYTMLDSFDMQGCSQVSHATDVGSNVSTVMPSPPVSEGRRITNASTSTSTSYCQSSGSPYWSPFASVELRNVASPDQALGYSGALQHQRSQNDGDRHERTSASRSVSSQLEVDTTQTQHTLINDAAQSKSHKSQGSQGWMSSLHIAAQNGHHGIVRMLLQHKGDSNELDSDGMTPLFYATISGHEHVVTLLLEHGAQIRGSDDEGRTVLHLAVVHRRESVLKALLRHCAGDQTLIDGYDNAGRTPLHVAVDIDFEAGVSVLLEHGANLNLRHVRLRETALWERGADKQKAVRN